MLSKLPVLGRPTNLDYRQGPIVLAVGADVGCLDIFSLICHFSFLFPSLWETARYRLKYCFKGPLSPKQPTNQHPWGGAMVPGKLPVPGRPTNLHKGRGQGPTALAEGADGGCLDIFLLSNILFLPGAVGWSNGIG